MKERGKHLLLSQPALLPGRWLAHSRNACGCQPRWPMYLESLLQNEGVGERGRQQRTRESPEQALPAWSQGMTHRPHSIISNQSSIYIPLIYFLPSRTPRAPENTRSFLINDSSKLMAEHKGSLCQLKEFGMVYFHAFAWPLRESQTLS